LSDAHKTGIYIKRPVCVVDGSDDDDDDDDDDNDEVQLLNMHLKADYEASLS